jgi:hypothetical protein
MPPVPEPVADRCSRRGVCRYRGGLQNLHSPGKLFTIWFLTGASTAKRHSSVYNRVVIPCCRILILSAAGSIDVIGHLPTPLFVSSASLFDVYYQSGVSCVKHRISSFYFLSALPRGCVTLLVFRPSCTDRHPSGYPPGPPPLAILKLIATL